MKILIQIFLLCFTISAFAQQTDPQSAPPPPAPPSLISKVKGPAINTLNFIQRKIQYFNVAGMIFSGDSVQAGNTVFLPARYIIKNPTGDKTKPYWVVDLFRVGFNPGTRDLWDLSPASHFVDISGLRVYEVIKIHPIAGVGEGFKSYGSIYSSPRAITTAFKSMAEETIESMSPGDAVVVNRYWAVGASAVAEIPMMLLSGPKAWAGVEVQRKNGVVFLKTGENEVVADWREQNAKGLQAGLAFKILYKGQPILSAQYRKEKTEDSSYRFDLTDPEQKAALFANLTEKSPDLPESLQLSGQFRTMTKRGSYFLASLLGFFTQQKHREKIQIHYEEPSKNLTREIVAVSSIRDGGGKNRQIQTVCIEGETCFLRFEASFDVRGLTGRELEAFQKKALKLYPKPIGLEQTEFPAISGHTKFNSLVLYPEAALQEILSAKRTSDEVCSVLESELPPGTPWCEYEKALPTNIDVFHYSTSRIRDPEAAQTFREILMGMHGFLDAYRSAKARLTKGGLKNSMNALENTLSQNSILPAVFRTMDRLAGEAPVYRHATLTTEGLDPMVLEKNGTYAPSPAELSYYLTDLAALSSDAIYRAIEPLFFTTYYTTGIDGRMFSDR